MKRSETDFECGGEYLKAIKVIMLDIEGTTTSISFVKEELFPYVRKEVRTYLQETWEEDQTVEDVGALLKQMKQDKDSGIVETCPTDGAPREELIPSLVSGILGMMDADRKVGPLKKLQGHMWRRAYSDGTVKGHVYEDVLDALKEWKAMGKEIVIYSSGSVEAQKLLFGHSCFGNLLQYFSRHFDTGVGSKVESDSYKTIARQLNCSTKDVLFVTDLPKEAYAAKGTGMKVILSVREGTTPLSAEDKATFPQVTSFLELLDQSSSSSPSKKSRTDGQSGGDVSSKDDDDDVDDGDGDSGSTDGGHNDKQEEV